MRVDPEEGPPITNIYGESEELFTCWCVVAIVFTSVFLMMCVLYYNNNDDIGNNVYGNGPTDKNGVVTTHYELKRMDCGCCDVLLNTGFRKDKLVYTKRGEKTTHEVTGDSPALPHSSFNKECALCLEEFDDFTMIVRLSCEHAYHKGCIKEWIIDKDEFRCPLCSETIMSDMITQDVCGGDEMMGVLNF